VVDVDSRYYLIGMDYPRCGRCKVPYCPWNPVILSQLDPSHRNMFPAVLTKNEALDRKCITLMKPRTQGNSSSYIQQALHEVHSEEWGKRCIQYLTDCESHQKGAVLTGNRYVYKPPHPFRPLPLAQWFELAHANEILSHVEEMKGIITSTYGRVLKVDSTKKVCDYNQTCQERPPVNKDHILFVPLTYIKNKFYCEQRLPAYKDHFFVFHRVVFEDRFDCNKFF
jgi:hypothetical protein